MIPTRTNPTHAHQPEAWHQCWDDYHSYGEQIAELLSRRARSTDPLMREHLARVIKILRESQRAAVARAQTLSVNLKSPISNLQSA